MFIIGVDLFQEKKMKAQPISFFPRVFYESSLAYRRWPSVSAALVSWTVCL